jgi:hypothetical protein
MAGKWTPELEEAYNAIKDGNFSMGQYNIFLQVLKPFLFT